MPEAANCPAEGDDDATRDAERRLLQAAQGGDREAFRTLLESVQGRVYWLVMRTLRCDRDTAADLAQEVFLRVYRGLPGFDGRARFSTWVHTIAMNLAISEYRRRRTLKRDRPTLSIDAPVGGTDDLHIEPAGREVDPGARADQREFAAAVRDAVAELPDEFREAVLLRDLQDLSYEEISEILGVPPGTVRSRIHRGRAILQQRLRGFQP